MTISEAFDLYSLEAIKLAGKAEKTAVNYRTTKRNLLAALGDIPIQLVTIEQVSRWRLYMDSQGLQGSTIKGNLSNFRTVLKFLKRRRLEVLDFRDVDLPKIIRSQMTILTPEEVDRMVDAATNPRDKAIVECLFSTACRISELLSLNRGDIQGNRAVVLGKGSKLRPLYFTDQALRLIKEYEDTRRDRLPPLFVSGQYRRITVSRVEQILHCITADAGIDKNVTPHVFRHSSLSDYIAKGADMYAVQKIAGHASIQTTLNTYTHVSDQYTKDAFDKFRSQRS